MSEIPGWAIRCDKEWGKSEACKPVIDATSVAGTFCGVGQCEGSTEGGCEASLSFIVDEAL